MSLRGGGADKVGNRYELRWTVQCMVRLLKGEAVSIYLEEPGVDEAEFQLIASDGTIEFHQVKKQNGTKGHWSISELKDREILSDFWQHSRQPNHKFVFISTEAVKELKELCERVRIASSWGQFTDRFMNNKQLNTAFRTLKNMVKADSDEDLFQRLKSFTLTVIDEHPLKRSVEAEIAPYTSTDPANAVDVLAVFALDSIHKQLTRSDIIEHLQARGIFKDVTQGQNKVSRSTTCPIPPNPPAHFTGRETELARLKQELDTNTGTIIAVRSMGGMGKTSLVQQLCHLPDKPFDAVLWATLSENPQPLSVLLEWGRYAVEDYKPTPETRPEEIAAWVRGQLTRLINNNACGSRWLVVLDDVWNTDICYEAVVLLQKALPSGIRTLITTRQVDTAGYLKAQLIELDELSINDAFSLLQRLRYNPHLTKSHLEQAAKLIKGHPLTLELVSASLNNAEDETDIEVILDDYEHGINDGNAFEAMQLDVETPKMLNVVFGRSYRALTRLDQARFRALGILGPDTVWERSLAGAIWNINEERELISAHKRLRLCGLIEQAKTNKMNAAKEEVAIYRQHPLLRAYARALLTDAEERKVVFERYTDYIIQVCYQFYTLPPEMWENNLVSQYSHILYVGDELVIQTHTGTTGDILRAFFFSVQIMAYIYYRPEVQRITWLEMGLQTSRNLQTSGRETDIAFHQSCEAVFLKMIGMACFVLGDYQKALESQEQALTLFRMLGDQRSEASVINNIGKIRDAMGDHQAAVSILERALNLFQALEDPSGEAMTLNDLGTALDHLGNRAKAIACYEQAIKLRKEMGDIDGATLNNIGYIAFRNGNLERSLEIQLRLLQLTRETKDVLTEATVTLNIAVVYLYLGQIDKAMEYTQMGKDILLRHRLPQNISGQKVSDYNLFLDVLKQELNKQLPDLSTLPTRTIQALYQHISLAKTSHPHQIALWQQELTQLRSRLLSYSDMTNELTFIDALLAILSDRTPSVPTDNPYADTVKQILITIKKYRAKTSVGMSPLNKPSKRKKRFKRRFKR